MIVSELCDLVGLAVPFNTWRVEPGTGIRSAFAYGALAKAIHQEQIELQVDHCWHEFLADQRHGLTLWEAPNGVYFRASITVRTPFARQIVEGVASGKIKHLCMGGGETLTTVDEDGVKRHIEVAAREISLLLQDDPCFRATWVAIDGPEAKARIALENVQATFRQLHVLDNDVWQSSPVTNDHVASEREN